MLNKQEETLLKELLNKYKQGYISGLIQGDNINLTPSGCRNKIISSTGGGGSPAGSDTQIQYNNAGAFGADALFTRDVATGNANLAKDTIQQSAVTFTGSGLDDLQIAPTFSGSTPTTYTITISSTGTPDTFDWTDGVNSGTNVPMDVMGNALSNGLVIGFLADTGHTNGDSWSWTYTKSEKFAFKLTDDFGGDFGSGQAGVLQKYENITGGVNRLARLGITEVQGDDDGEYLPFIISEITDSSEYYIVQLLSVDGVIQSSRNLSTNNFSHSLLNDSSFYLSNKVNSTGSVNGISFFDESGITATRIGNLSGGNNTKITIDDVAQTINFNGEYSFPFADGTSGQTLVTDGAGTLSWAAAGGGGQIAFTKTKAEIDALIAGNDLVKNALYEITGVHPTLYDDGTTSGTTVYLRAISGSELEVQGMGMFYNPKYNQAVDGFGIWDNKMYGTLSNVVGVFDYLNKESVTADNSATGLILADGMIQWVSGDWSVAVSITGSVSGATADITGFVTPTYSIGDKVIWGGYSWTNVNGNIGASVDVLNLDAEWTKNVYDTTNYNIAYDVIEYDYANDMIIRRFEKESNVDVKCSKAQYDFFVDNYGIIYHAISVQQFGNEFKISISKGQLNIDVDNGYNESVNFSGEYQNNLTFGSGAYQQNLTFDISAFQNNLTFDISAFQSYLTFGSGAYQNNLTFGSGAYQNNLTFGSGAYQNNLTFGSGAYQEYLTFDSGAYQNNLTFGSDTYQGYLTFGIYAYQNNLTFGSDTYQGYLTFGSSANQQNITFGIGAWQYYLTFGDGAYQTNLTFGNGANQTNLTFGSSANQQNITFGISAWQYYLTFGGAANQGNLTFGNGAYQSYLTFGIYAYQHKLTFDSGAYQQNLTFAENTQLDYNNQTLNSNIQYVSFRTKAVIVPNLSSATYIYDNTLLKDIYTRPDGTLKLKYMNDSDVLVVNNITD